MAVQIARWMVFEKRTLKLEKQEACAIRQPRKMESSNAAIVLARSGRQRFMSPIFHFMKLYVVCAICDEAAFPFPMFLSLLLPHPVCISTSVPEFSRGIAVFIAVIGSGMGGRTAERGPTPTKPSPLPTAKH